MFHTQAYCPLFAMAKLQHKSSILTFTFSFVYLCFLIIHWTSEINSKVFAISSPVPFPIHFTLCWTSAKCPMCPMRHDRSQLLWKLLKGCLKIFFRFCISVKNFRSRGILSVQYCTAWVKEGIKASWPLSSLWCKLMLWPWFCLWLLGFSKTYFSLWIVASW